MTKQKHMEAIRKVLQEAKAHGYLIAVASDEEGNNWNEINPEVLFFEAKDDVIALSVWRQLEEEDIMSLEEVIINN